MKLYSDCWWKLQSSEGLTGATKSTSSSSALLLAGSFSSSSHGPVQTCSWFPHSKYRMMRGGWREWVGVAWGGREREKGTKMKVMRSSITYSEKWCVSSFLSYSVGSVGHEDHQPWVYSGRDYTSVWTPGSIVHNSYEDLSMHKII